MVEIFPKTDIGTISVLTSCKPWILAFDKDAFWTWSWSIDTTDLSTTEIDDPESQIASLFRLKFLFVSLIRTTGSPPWVKLIATAVVASEIFSVVSLFGKLLCKILLRRLPQLGTLHVLLLQYFEMWPGLKQLKWIQNGVECRNNLVQESL